MKVYALYAGLGGGFGGSTYIRTTTAENEDEGAVLARNEAVEIYESYEGSCGVLDPDECEEQEEDYEGGVENWITYEAKELTSNNIMDFIEDESIGSDEEVWIRGMIIEYNV